MGKRWRIYFGTYFLAIVLLGLLGAGTYKEPPKSISKSKITVMVFGATWCHLCRNMDAESWNNKDVLRILAKYKNFEHIDTDEQEQKTRKYKVRILPTILFVDEKGKVLKSVHGYLPKDKVIELLNSNLKQTDVGEIYGEFESIPKGK